jgi:hypothetical protein
MDLLNGVGSGYQQVLVTALESQAAKILQRQILHLQIGPHRAVKDDDAFL